MGSGDLLWLQLCCCLYEAADLAALTAAVATADAEKGPVAQRLLSHRRKYSIAKITNIPHIPESVTVASRRPLWCLIGSNKN